MPREHGGRQPMAEEPDPLVVVVVGVSPVGVEGAQVVLRARGVGAGPDFLEA